MCCRVSDIRFCIALIFPLGLANFAVVLYSVIVYDYPLTNFIEDNFSAKSCLIRDKKILSAVLTNKLSNFSSFMEIKFIFLFLNLTSDSCRYSAHWMIVTSSLNWNQTCTNFLQKNHPPPSLYKYNEICSQFSSKTDDLMMMRQIMKKLMILGKFKIQINQFIYSFNFVLIFKFIFFCLCKIWKNSNGSSLEYCLRKYKLVDIDCFRPWLHNRSAIFNIVIEITV